MKNFKILLTFFYLLVIIHICLGKFLRETVPRRKKGSNGSKNNSIKPRVIGGRPSYPGEFPYQVQIKLGEYHICGGTLVIAPSTGKQIVITAAHCVFPNMLSDTIIRAGSIFIDGSDAQELTLKRAVTHPKYVELTNDIAILFPNGEFQLNKTLQPLELPGPNEIVRKEIIATGWGKTGELSDTLPKRLQALVMPVVSNRKCGDIWKRQGGTALIRPTHLCAGNLKGAQTVCNGDSGGPAMAVDKKGKRFLAGTASFGRSGCAVKGWPAVFTRVSKYLKWIDEISKQFQTER